MNNHPLERISAYADGELDADEARGVEAHLGACTECARELALIRALGGAMKASVSDYHGVSVWDRVNRSIARPIGWMLFVGGLSAWAVMGLIEWFQAGTLSVRWLATTGIGLGFGLMVAGIGYEQYRAWKAEPYRHVER
jgi:anti-sigma factor RsiW